MKTYDEKRKAFYITAGITDFEGTVTDWKLAFYQLWRYQMTWNFAYLIDLHDLRDKGATVQLVVREAYVDNVLGLMEDLGYRNVYTTEASVGIIWSVDRKDCADVMNLFEE